MAAALRLRKSIRPLSSGSCRRSSLHTSVLPLRLRARFFSTERLREMEKIRDRYQGPETVTESTSAIPEPGSKAFFKSQFIPNRSPSTEIHLDEQIRKYKKKEYDEFPTTQPEDLVSHPQTKITTLPNGLRVATETSPINNSTATVGVWIDTGSRYETKENNGVAHFLEHLAFKGTKKRSQRQLEQEVEDIGAHLNAYTSREQTVYYAQGEKKHIPQAMDILSDILLNSQLADDSIENERHVILREMEAVYQDTDELVFDHLHETAFHNNALGQTILGPKENIKSIKRKDIVDYIETHYTADRMVICGAGAVDHDDLVKLTQEKFGGIPTESKHTVVKEPAKFMGSQFEERWDDMGVAHVAIGYPTCGWKDPNVYPLLFLHSMLGTWDKSLPGGQYSSSELVKLAACSGMCDSVMAFNTLYSDTGLFGVYFTAQPRRLADAARNVRNEMTRLCYEMDYQMVEQAKNQVSANMLMALDSSSTVCEDIGRQILTIGRRIHPAEMIARINAVTPRDVMNVARLYLHDRDHAMAAVGALHEAPAYSDIRDGSYWWRA